MSCISVSMPFPMMRSRAIRLMVNVVLKPQESYAWAYMLATCSSSPLIDSDILYKND